MIRNYFSLALFLLLANNALHAQVDSPQELLFNQIYLAAEKEYGIDQELINGPLFENKNQDVNGHPYLLDYYSNTGSVVFKGKQYSNLNLRYDIYGQQLLLIYLFDTLEYKLHLQKEFITGFTIENRKFINETFSAGENKKYYQVFGEDFPIRIFYFWKKDLSNLYANNPDIKVFSPAQKESFILLNGKGLSYKGNRTFANSFSSKSKAAIKEYLRKHKIKVLQASDNEMELLIEFINSLAE